MCLSCNTSWFLVSTTCETCDYTCLNCTGSSTNCTMCNVIRLLANPLNVYRQVLVSGSDYICTPDCYDGYYKVLKYVSTDSNPLSN